MRAKALITLTLLALILPACATTSADRQNVRTPEELDYMLKVREIAVSHKTYMESYVDVLDTNNRSFIYRSSSNTIEKVQSVLDELNSMTPPVRYSEFHRKFIRVFEKDIIALSHMIRADEILLGFKEGTEKDAIKHINMATESMLEANNLMLKAKAIWPK